VPEVLDYKFNHNPNYNIKKLFSGMFSQGSNYIYYPTENYFRNYKIYLFRNVPKQIAEKVLEIIGKDISQIDTKPFVEEV
jgi:hypothetical protein